MKVWIFQHVDFEGPGKIGDWIERRRLASELVCFFKQPAEPLIQKGDILIIMGGPMNVYEEEVYPWLRREKNIILRAINDEIPVLGICLGAQLLADVLGAKVFPNLQPEIGWFPITRGKVDTLLSPLLFERQTVFHWHAETFELPARSLPLCSSAGCVHQGFLFPRRVVGLQFHLEVTVTDIQAMLENNPDYYTKRDYIQTREEILKQTAVFATYGYAVLFRILDYLAGK